MDELKWELLTEVQGRLEAELLKTYFGAYGIEVLFQDDGLATRPVRELG